MYIGELNIYLYYKCNILLVVCYLRNFVSKLSLHNDLFRPVSSTVTLALTLLYRTLYITWCRDIETGLHTEQQFSITSYLL